jgi:hypothetical protein
MKIKNFLYILFFSLFTLTAFAEDVDVEVEPKDAIINETFFVTFKIKTKGDEEPYISFTPFGASVLGKRSQGLSISTVVINGKFTTTKEQAVVYELQAERVGQVYLKNVKVELGGKTIPVNEVRINVLSEPRRIPDAFMEAEASKTKVYIGEGLDVNYYLYFKSSISANDVKEFPKLNKFIKRFHHVNSPVETVQYKGQVLKRILAYSARLYPEKVGKAVLDPMKISVQILENEYSGYGFGTQRFKNKDLASPMIDVEILPLPTEGVPASFTGLVGEHEFSLSVPKTKYVINEPIELKLEAKGKGALENFDAPVIYSDNNLEQFDTKSEVTETGAQSAKKTFDYTLLARGPVNISARDLPLAYFDPASGRYIEKKVTIPAISVSGVAAPQADSTKPSATPHGEQATPGSSLLDGLFTSSKAVTPNQQGLVGPVMKEADFWKGYVFHIFNAVLILVIISFVGFMVFGHLRGNTIVSNESAKTSLKLLKKQGLSYSELYKLLSSLDKNNKMAAGGISIVNIVEQSPLNKEAKDYFKDALSYTEQGSYGKNSNSNKMAFNRKHFSELMKYV